MNADQNTPLPGQAAGAIFPTELLNSAKIRVSEALARFAGDESRYRHWLVEFIGHGPTATAQIKQSIADGAHDAALKQIHALKGRAGMLGMSELHAISQTLETTLRNNEPTALKFDELEQSIKEMCQALGAALGQKPQ